MYVYSVAAAGVSPAVEPVVPPGGLSDTTALALKSPGQWPVGETPPSTAGGTLAATQITYFQVARSSIS